MGKVKTEQEFLEELEERFPFNKVKILDFSGASKPISYKCLCCNKIYYKNRANHLYENKTLCQICYTSRDSEVRNKFIYALGKSNFEAVSPIGAISTKVKIKCKKCGREIEVYQYNFIKSIGERKCPKCEKFGEKSKEDFIYRMQERATEYQIINYKDFTHKVKLQHKCGFVFSQLPANFLKGRGCPKCFGKISKGEQKIIRWLENNNIQYEYQKKFKELSSNLSFDFYIPDLDILIEYQGEQHYIPIQAWGGEEKLKAQKERDERKRIFCKNNHIKLIEIPYWDQNNLENYLFFLKGSTTSLIDVASSEAKEN